MIGLCTWLFYHPWGGRFELMHFAMAQTLACSPYFIGLLLILPKAETAALVSLLEWSKRPYRVHSHTRYLVC
jgi:hypothetical protein